MLKVRPLPTLRLATISACIALGFATLGCGEEKTEKAPEKKPTPEASAETNTPPAAIAAPVARPEPIAPPKDVFGGNARLINLAMQDGAPVAIDIWAMQSALYTPVKLAENVAFGKSTEWFQSPKGSQVRVFLAGTEPSPEAVLTALSYARKGSHVTAMLLNRADGTFMSSSSWDTSDDPNDLQAPDAPPEGKGYVVLRANQLRLHEEAMATTTGGEAFQVGDGKKSCLPQRVEDNGFPPSRLGGTQPVKLDLAPGTHTISLHKRDAKGCTKASKVYEVTLEVNAGEAQTVVLFTPDSKAIEHIVLSTPVNATNPYGTSKALRDKMSAARKARHAKKEAERAKKAAEKASDEK